MKVWILVVVVSVLDVLWSGFYFLGSTQPRWDVRRGHEDGHQGGSCRRDEGRLSRLWSTMSIRRCSKT